MQRKILKPIALIAVLVGVCLIVIGLTLSASAAALHSPTSARRGAQLTQSADLLGSALTGAAMSTLSCREGFAGAGWQPYLNTIDLTLFGAGVYADFNAHNPPGPPQMEYVQIIRVRQLKDGNGNYLSSYVVTPTLSDAAGGLGPIVANNLKSLWLVGNEPDRGPNPNGSASGQDDTFPEMYARIYHDVYEFIKQRDPAAQVAVAGLVEVTPGRMQYLDKVLNAYSARYGASMPVDVWNMHLYILPEEPGIANWALGTDPALAFLYSSNCSAANRYCYADHDDMTEFERQVRRMRQWMKDHGQQDKPLLLSEFSLLYDDGVTDEYSRNFTPPRAATFLTRTFNYLASATDAGIGMPSDRGRLVQQWIWFSLIHPGSNIGSISDLVTSTAPVTFTQVGHKFRASVLSRPVQSNLAPRLNTGPGPLMPAGQTVVTATVSVDVVNNGNLLVAVPVTVTFYSDQALTQPISSVVVTDSLPGCARRSLSVRIDWPDRGVGSHTYWVKVDTSDAVTESDESDNVLSGQVFVGQYGVYMPLLKRTAP